jgi:hypothetical protein
VSGETLARLSLDGSDKVVWAVAECNNRLQAMRALRAQEDPFSPPKDLKDKTTRPTRGAGREWGS